MNELTATYHQNTTGIPEAFRTTETGSEKSPGKINGCFFQGLDYYPFGSLMPGRNMNASDYRFGFNSMEKDDEWTGVTGSHLNFGARIYDSRIGRWLACDPLFMKYPYLSSYQFVANSPIIFIDPDGKIIRGVKLNTKTGKIEYTRAAIKRGTKRYIEARSKTETGRQKVMAMIKDERKYDVRVTDRILVQQLDDGSYAITSMGGQSDDQRFGVILVSADLTEYEDIDPEKEYEVVVVGDKKGEKLLKKRTIKGSQFKDPLEEPSDEKTEAYKKLREDLDYEKFNKEHPIKTSEQKIHAAGAHEEVHATEDDNPFLPTYEAEKPAHKQEMKERLEYEKEVIQPDKP